MHKTALDMTVAENRHLTSNYSLLVLRADKIQNTDTDQKENTFSFADILPGQFVQVRIDQSKTTFLRRPISVNFVYPEKNELHLLVRRAGKGTDALCDLKTGENLNIILSLGNGFSLPSENEMKEGFNPLLVGGGVGVAPSFILENACTIWELNRRSCWQPKARTICSLWNVLKTTAQYMYPPTTGQPALRGL